MFVCVNTANMHKVFLDCGFYIFGCVAHIIQLVVADVLIKQKDHDDICKKDHNIVEHLKHSIKTNVLLNQYQIQNIVPQINYFYIYYY